MIRDYQEKDYATLCEWWEKQKFPAPPDVYLPGTGYIANETAAGFLYLTNSALSWMEFVVVNPAAEKTLRNKSITEVIEHICAQAAAVGSIMVFTSSNRWPFLERLKSMGFVVGDTNTAQLFRKVG